MLRGRGYEVIAYLDRAEAALEATLEIGARAAEAKFGFRHQALDHAVRSWRSRPGPPYVEPPSDDLAELGRRLGYSRIEVMRMTAHHGKGGLTKRLQAEWRKTAQERPEFLHVDPARPPTTDPAQAAEDGEIARIPPAMEKRIRDERRATWERERDRMNEALDNLQEAGLGGRELFTVRKRIEALDRRMSEAA